MPPKRKISTKRARLLLRRLYNDTVMQLIDDAAENRDNMRHAMPHENPRPYMVGPHPSERRYVGFGDVRRMAHFQPAVDRFRRFRFRGKAKKTLGKRKRR